MYRESKTGNDIREKILQGIDEVASIVGKTLGPKGRNVVLDTNKFTDPIITNDGVTIVREFNSKDKYKNIGIKIAREVAGKTNDSAGDGTTTATVLLQELTRQVAQVLVSGANAVMLRKGIDDAVNEVIKSLKNEAKKTDNLDDLVSIATISCGDKKIGEMVAKLVSELGNDCLISLEDNIADQTEAEKIEGLRVSGRLLSEVFINETAQQQCSLDNVAVLVTDMNITTQQEAIRIMEIVSGAGKKDAVIIAENFDNQALLTCVVNKLQGNINIVPVKVLTYGEIAKGYLNDIAKVTGGVFFSSDNGYKFDDLTFSEFGIADKIVANKEKATIIGGDGDKQERIEELQAQLKTDLKDYEKQSVEERIAKLKSSLGVIKVGGVTEFERKERKMRIEDAINATKAALNDGIIRGGGIALYCTGIQLKEQDKDYQMGVNAVLQAIKKPTKLMVENSGLETVNFDGLDKDKTVDFSSGEVVNAYENGIIDPVKVVVSALRFAGSASAMFATTEAGIIVEDEGLDEQNQD